MIQCKYLWPLDYNKSLNKVCEYVTPQKLYIEICELIFQTVLVAVVVY
jgi:hypothetical protein